MTIEGEVAFDADAPVRNGFGEHLRRSGVGVFDANVRRPWFVHYAFVFEL